MTRKGVQRSWLTGLFLMVQIGTSAQIVDQQLSWLALFGNHRLTERWGLHTEYQLRRQGPVENWQQSLLRFGVDYHLSSGPIITAGYAWIYTWPYGEQPIAFEFNEHRIWQQVVLNQKAGRLHLNHRYRPEQRFLEQRQLIRRDGTSRAVGYQFKQRMRYRLAITFPFMREKMPEGRMFIMAYDEIFAGFGRNIDRNILEQNRLYGGIGWRFNSNSNVRVGYLNQYIVKSDGLQAERNHTVELAFTWNLDLRRAEIVPE